MARPNLIKVYNSAKGGVDLLDWAVGTYPTKIKGEKGWWPHFTNTLGILMGAAWNIYCVISPDADQSLLAFFRSVVKTYLHLDEIVLEPSFWKIKVVVHDSNRLTGRSHWPTTREKQQRFALLGCSIWVRTFLWKSISKPSIPGNDIIYTFVVLVHMMLKNI